MKWRTFPVIYEINTRTWLQYLSQKFGEQVTLGIYAGTFFFYLVFHALTHPVRSARYVSINESVVGAGGILGPALGGLIMDHWSFGRACLVGSALILLVSFFQAAIHRLHPPSSI